MTQSLVIVSHADNDLCAALRECGVVYQRDSSIDAALQSAPAGSGVLVLADGYPDALTPVTPSHYAAAAGKSLRRVVEFPAATPDAACGAVREVEWERAVVASDAFAPDLASLQILAVHRARYVTLPPACAHLVLARVAGFESAIYGLPEQPAPLLWEHPSRPVLLAAAKLSGFISGRFAPAASWAVIWRWILHWACPDRPFPPLVFAPAVRPRYGPAGILPAAAERDAVELGAGWYRRARLLIHPAWQEQARTRLYVYPDGTGPGPDAGWPSGDGSCGMLEGASSQILPDGSQYWRYYLRSDCMGEAAMALAAAGGLLADHDADRAAANLNDFIYLMSPAAQGPRGDPASPSYGLVSWALKPPADGIYYGDDNARLMLGTMASAALLRSDRWDAALLRCLLANLRTTGPLGFRGGRITEPELQEKGWRHFWETPRVHYAPHYESWLWACFLWAYQHTGYAPFIERALSGIRLTMDAYPGEWRWTNGIQQERARMLLPLAWLVRVDDRPEHRGWLRFMAGELLQRQDASGAIGEEVGSRGHGSYAPPASNADYGVSEAPLIQQNGDPLCDLLYTANFAFAGLHEAAAATGDALYASAGDRLAELLCRIQIHAPSHPELHGGWYRAFDFRRWDYWASNSDIGWGAWSIESGWTQGWITSVLALRQMRTSLWDLTAGSCIASHLAAHTCMLPR